MVKAFCQYLCGIWTGSRVEWAAYSYRRCV